MSLEKTEVFQPIAGVHNAGVLPEESVVQRNLVGVSGVCEEGVGVNHKVRFGLVEKVEHGFDDWLDKVRFEGTGGGRVGGSEGGEGNGGGDFDGVVEVIFL